MGDHGDTAEDAADRARRVITLAREEARQLGHAQVGTEHLLLGLAREATTRPSAN